MTAVVGRGAGLGLLQWRFGAETPVGRGLRGKSVRSPQSGAGGGPGLQTRFGLNRCPLRSVFAARVACCRPVGWLFAGKSSSMPMKSVEHAHQKALARAGLSFVLYDFRHTCATRWAERGMGVETIARLLGHANLRSCDRCTYPRSTSSGRWCSTARRREAQAGPIRVQ